MYIIFIYLKRVGTRLKCQKVVHSELAKYIISQRGQIRI